MPERPNKHVIGNLVANLQADLNQHRDVIRGHDAVHPDRNVCGGVGGCKMLMAEVELIQTIEDTLIRATRFGLTVTVNIHPDGGPRG